MRKILKTITTYSLVQTPTTIARHFSTQQPQATPYSLNYTQKPLNPVNFQKMLVSELRQKQSLNTLDLPQLFHHLNMYKNKLIPFSYDYYQQIGHILIKQQQNLTIDQILLFMDLGIQYQIRNEFVYDHLENQIYMRVFHQYQKEIEQYTDSIQEWWDNIIEECSKEKGDSLDFYTEQFVKGRDSFIDKREEEKKLQDKEEEKLEVKKNKNKNKKGQKQMSKQGQKQMTEKDQKNLKFMKKYMNRPKEITIHKLLEIAIIFKKSGCTNLPFLQYLIEILTIKLEQPSLQTPTNILTHLQTLNYVCQLFKNELQKNKQRYTPRSMKNIYKFQGFYLQEHFLQLDYAISKFQDKQLLQLLQEYNQFDIKKRSHRRMVGEYVIPELKRRQLIDQESYCSQLFKLNQKDVKMNRRYAGQLYDLVEDQLLDIEEVFMDRPFYPSKQLQLEHSQLGEKQQQDDSQEYQYDESDQKEVEQDQKGQPTSDNSK